MKRKSQKGYTIMEIMIVLAIIGSVTISTLVGVYSLRQKNKETQTIAVSAGVLEKLKYISAVSEDFDLFGEATTFSVSNAAFSDTNAKLTTEMKNNKMIPDGNVNGDQAVNSFGETIVIKSTKNPTTISLSNINLAPSNCVNIAEALLPYTDSLIIQNDVASSYVKNEKGEVDMKELRDACISAKTNTVVAVLYLEK